MPTQNESPLDILRRRYAKGEIAREEYEKMKKDLEG
jgi:putative membrane protein